MYKEHQSELYQKLVSIMNERVQSHIGNMKNINWDAPTPTDIPDPSQPTTHMMLLVKETGIL